VEEEVSLLCNSRRKKNTDGIQEALNKAVDFVK
jgi:hypothetical protein